MKSFAFSFRITFIFTGLLWISLQVTAQKASSGYSRFDTTRTEEIFYSITRINNTTADSAFITISSGKKNGLFETSEGELMGTYSGGNGSKRESAVFLGKARIIQLKDTESVILVHFFKKYRNSNVFINDLVSLKTYPQKGLQKSIFYELARLNIQFIDNSRQPVISIQEILNNKNKQQEEELMTVYTTQITSFYTDLKTFTDSMFTVPYKNGRFRGMNMIDAFRVTTRYDLHCFFNFVKTYPGKYMGNRFKINEAYATWVLNETFQGDNNREWLLPYIEITPEEYLDNFVKSTAYYINYDSLYLWKKRVNELQQEAGTAEAASLCNKLLYISKQLKDKVAENEFYYTRSLLNDALGKKENALSDAEAAYRQDPFYPMFIALSKPVMTNDGEAVKTDLKISRFSNYAYQLANLYGRNENYTNCYNIYKKLLLLLPGNSNITGNYGWYLLAGGNVDEAAPYCRDAYFSNPYSVAFAVNYGHTFLLKGMDDSARHYYTISLKNCYTANDYTEGPKTDFELFFKKGWQRKKVAEMADWMENEYNEKYAAITKGNSIWDEARREYDNGSYNLAINKWKQYIQLFDESKDPPQSAIHNALNWIGVSFSYLGKNDSTIFYYRLAEKMAKEKLVPLRDSNTNKQNDYLVNDYERLYNFYNSIGNSTRAQEYLSLFEAEGQKVTELFAQPNIFLLTLSSGIDTGNARLLESHIRQISTATKNNNFIKQSSEDVRPLANDTNTFILPGKNTSREKLLSTITRIRQQSYPEDIFILYFDGETVMENGSAKIVLNSQDPVNGTILQSELLEMIDQVYAQKKIIITNKPNLSLFSLITSKYVSGTPSSELVFLCPGVETPKTVNGYSIFTDELVNAVNELVKKGKFSARDLVDKTSYSIGRGKFFIPVISLSFGKDFLLYDRKVPDSNSMAGTPGTRGIIIKEPRKNEPESQVSGTQKNYALLFATDVYDDGGDDGFKKLANPIYDAKQLGDILQDEFGFEAQVVKNPTYDSILNKLSEYRDMNYGPNDQLFIFFAGHGVYHEKSKMGYIVAKDSKKHDPNHKTYFSYSDLGNIYLRNIGCNRIFLVLDACFAGTFFENNTVRGSPTDIAKENLSILKKLAANQHFKKGMSSGAKEYVSDGKEKEHSPFAGSFINNLTSKALSKGFVTADEIISEIKSHPPASTAICEGNFQYSDPQSHFIFELNTGKAEPVIRNDKQQKKLSN